MELLCLNGGSSSLKYAAYRIADHPTTDQLVRCAAGVERATGDAQSDLARVLLQVDQVVDGPIGAIGHRIVFGGHRYEAPTPAGEAVLRDLESFVPIEPLHLRGELDLVYAAMRSMPGARHVLCFDTAFHRKTPAIAKRLPLPPEIDPLLQRYGFHGLSYEYIVSELDPDTDLAVVAHLGSGASLCALKRGRPLDTTMGFSALGGLMMGTRPGDLDPGVIVRLLDSDGYDAARLSNLLYQGSGLLGVSGTSSDMQSLLSAADSDPRAADAIELFVYQLNKHLGAMVAVLGGLDTLVFTGGIGEHAPRIRAAACQRLGYLGLALDGTANEGNQHTISSASSAVRVLVIPTDENLVIARHTMQLL
jgi:acetate kinase